MKIYREKAGIISPEPVWICFHKEYMYVGDTFAGLIKDMVVYWNNDRRLWL